MTPAAIDKLSYKDPTVIESYSVISHEIWGIKWKLHESAGQFL